MYAIVNTGGKQLRVSPGEIVRIERLSDEPVAKGDTILFQEVSFLSDGDRFQAGAPRIDGASVRATVLSEVRGPKIRIFKKKRRKQYRRTQGHRQRLVEVRIDAIEG
jgi:large subunit ribosomal protein L21